ncbi:hypothetical protein PanWU01x14_180510, partial [Parasponia andersonii]
HEVLPVSAKERESHQHEDEVLPVFAKKRQRGSSLGAATPNVFLLVVKMLPGVFQ